MYTVTFSSGEAIIKVFIKLSNNIHTYICVNICLTQYIAADIESSSRVLVYYLHFEQKLEPGLTRSIQRLSYGLEERSVGVRFPAVGTDFSLLHYPPSGAL